MAIQAKPDSLQLNLGLVTEAPLNLPLPQRSQLAAALGDLLLQALAAPEGKVATTEIDDEP
jgi:hypothetical protein